MNASIRLVRIALLAAPALLLTAGAPARGQGCTPFWATVPGVIDSPRSFVSFDDGSGPGLYATFQASDDATDTVWRYRNGVWTDLSAGLPSNPLSNSWPRWMWVKVLDSGTGPRLYILGNFQWGDQTNEYNESWGRVWDGSAWQPVDPNFVPSDLSVWPTISGDIGNGQQIFGTVQQVNGSGYQGLAVWTGSTWTHMGRALSASPAMTIGDFGAGPHLYIFGVAPIGILNPFWVWNGTDWEQPPGNQISISTRATGTASFPGVRDQCSVFFNDGTGPAIYVSGQIRLQSDPNHDIPGLGRWDGHTWTNCGGPNLGPNTIYARGPLTVFDDGTGSGPALYTTGGFSDYGGVPANGIARYSAGQWAGVGWGVLPGDDFRQLVVGRDSRGPSLFISGDDILHAGGAGVPAHNLVQLVGCPNCYANCDQSTATPALNVADFTCFLQKFAAPDPSANCDMSMTPPNLNVADFTCFLRKFAQGCP